MRLRELLIEALTTPIYDVARTALEKAFKSWIPGALHAVMHRSGWDHYEERKNTIPRETRFENDDWSNIRDEQYQAVYDEMIEAIDHHNDFYDELIDSFTNLTEETLRKTALDYIESTLGKIEPYIHGTGPDTDWSQFNKHLYWLQHLIVHLDTKATYKSGKPQTQGGHFQRYPDIKNYSNKYSKRINPKTDLTVAIKLYSTKPDIWLALSYILMSEVQTRLFGEPLERPTEVERFFEKILPTYVHEVTHLSQYARTKKSARGGLGKSGGLTYLPQINKDRKASELDRDSIRGPKSKKNMDRTYKQYKGGKRGNASRLPNEEITGAEYIEYLGSAHEIGAYAAGAAAEIIHQLMSDSLSNTYDEHQRQYDLNRGINDIITDIQHGYYENNSIKHYREYVRDFVNSAAKIVNLRAYQRQLPNDYWRTEHQLNPKMGRNITYPGKQPQLPV